MSGHNVTARDRVWAAIFQQQGRFRVADVRETIESDTRPADETIRRVLRSATDLGIIAHRSGSPYYRDTPVVLDPTGIDTDEFIEAISNEKLADVIYTEDAEDIAIEDIISDERAILAQRGHPESEYIPANPSSSGSELWKSAFRTHFADADYIVIVETSTGDLVDLSDHLDMERFESGTKILALGELRETPLFGAILNSLFHSHRADLEYQELSENDDQQIKEHVRSRVKAFDPDSLDWAEHVERLVEEVVQIVDPTDPREQSRLSEMVRSIADREA